MIEDLLRRFRDYYYAAPDYIRLPIGRSYSLLPKALRMGKTYREFSELLVRSKLWSEQEVLDYQFQELKKTFSVAFSDIPFYRRKFADYGLSYSDLKSFDDLERFPFLTKKEVKDNLNDMVNINIPAWKRLVTTTGGSTAEPMRFFQLKGVTRSKEKAFIYSGWKRIGYQPGMRLVQLRGRSVGDPNKRRYWDVEPIQNMLEMDSNYLTQETVREYLHATLDFKPEYMTGFPSSVYLFAKYLRDEKIEPPPLKGIMLASENLYPWQRVLLENIFDCPVISHYGHSEMVILAMQSRSSTDLLVFPEYGYLELINKENNNVTKPGLLGEMVGTSFHNPVMPFIRYKTQDYAEWGERSDPDYPYPVLRDIEGRLQEFIVTKDHRLISVCTMGAAHFDKLDNVYETQYVQNNVGAIEFFVVPKKCYTSKDREEIKRAIEVKTENSVNVSVVEVDSISKSPNGKHLMLKQKLPLNVLEGSQKHLIE